MVGRWQKGIMALAMALVFLSLPSRANPQYAGGESYEPDQQITDPCLVGDPEIWGPVCWERFGKPGGIDCYGPWNPNKTCSQQTRTLDQCYACCYAIKNCNLAKRKDKRWVESEFNACVSHCMTDKV
jgi:hypothetical protein